MPSRGKYEAAAVAAGWSPHPYFTEEAQALTWRYPDLHLRVWALPDGVHCLAYIQRRTDDGRVAVTEVARAHWMPTSVTELSVVEWGQRALAAWLARQVLSTVEQ